MTTAAPSLAAKGIHPPDSNHPHVFSVIISAIQTTVGAGRSVAAFLTNWRANEGGDKAIIRQTPIASASKRHQRVARFGGTPSSSND
jgi:hypothetical protein